MDNVLDSECDEGIRDADSSAYGISDRVVLAVADAEGTSPLELTPPLFESIDPDALDSIFENTVTGRGRTEGRVYFEMSGCEVEVHATGHVRVTDLERGKEAQGWVSPPSSSRANELAELDG
jgi:hypothetical protein